MQVVPKKSENAGALGVLGVSLGCTVWGSARRPISGLTRFLQVRLNKHCSGTLGHKAFKVLCFSEFKALEVQELLNQYLYCTSKKPLTLHP